MLLMFSKAGRLRVVAVVVVVRFAAKAFFGGSPTAPSVRAAAFARVTRVEAMFSAFSSVTVRLAVLAWPGVSDAAIPHASAIFRGRVHTGGIVTECVVEDPWLSEDAMRV